jgi:glycosyltransferase involved in cell wall biosynthesis
MAQLSVIIPLYNKESTIKTTIDSVLCQTFDDFELLVINDGSKDNSLEVVKSIIDPRIKIIDKQNEGVSRTRNYGAEISSTDLLFYLDADDFIYPNCLEIFMSLHEEYPDADLWSANYEKLSQGVGKIILSRSYRGLVKNPYKFIFLEQFEIRTGNCILTKSSFIKSGGYPTFITVGEDYYFMDVYVSKYKVIYSPEVVLSYIQDNRCLSKGGIDYHKVVEWYINFKHKNCWQRLSYSELIFKRTVVAIMHCNFKESFALILKFHVWLAYGCIAFIYKLIFMMIIHNFEK